MPDDRPDRSSLSAVAPIVEPSTSPEQLAEQAIARLARRWLRQALRGLAGRLGLLAAGGGVGAGLTTILDEDAPVITRQASASRVSSPEQQAAALDACEQARQDHRLVADICAAQAVACGADPASLPRPGSPPPTHHLQDPP